MISSAFTTSRNLMRRYFSRLCYLQGLAWCAIAVAILVAKLPAVDAVKEPTARKKPPGDSTSGFAEIGLPANFPLPASLSAPINPLDTRDYIRRRIRHGATLADLLGRHRFPDLTKRSGMSSPALEPVHPQPSEVELKMVSAAVDRSLFEDGPKAGVHASLLAQLADIFTWDMDLETVRKGDSFKILYEQRNHEDREDRSMRILAAEINTAGRKLTAVYFEKAQGRGTYYDLDGRTLARSFLRFPVEFIRISSHFTESRFHPILRTNLPHTGVDFAAARGTPVRAVGDGIVSQAGWNGHYGKSIDIQHDSSYTSRYAHLQGFTPGIREGMQVAKGQIIGYVGSTGRATGPHLHFELLKDQRNVDPLSVDLPAEDRIEPALQKIFESQTRTYLVELAPLTETSPQS